MKNRPLDLAVRFGMRAYPRHSGAKGADENPLLVRECIRVRGEDNHVDDGHRSTHDLEYAAFQEACRGQQSEMIARAIASPGEFIEPVSQEPEAAPNKKKEPVKKAVDKEIKETNCK